MPTLREIPKGSSNRFATPWQLYGRERILTLFGSIYSSIDVPVITADSVLFLAEEIFGGMMLLAQENSDPVNVIINNRGGSVPAGLLIIQGIEHLQAHKIDVRILVTGAAMSMASIILAAGTKGQRYAMERSVIHLHSGTVKPPEGDPEDVKRVMEYAERLRNAMHELLAERTSIPEYCAKRNELYDSLVSGSSAYFEEGKNRVKWIKEFLKEEQFLKPEEALEAGLVDEVLTAGDRKIDEIFRLNNATGRDK